EVEQEILTCEQVPQNVATADVGDVDRYPIADIADVGSIAAVFGDHTVDEQNSGTKTNEAACQRRTDKTHSTGDCHPRARKHFEPRMGRVTHDFLVQE